MPTKEPVDIKVVQEGDERYVLKTFADGGKERIPVVKSTEKTLALSVRKWSFDKSKKKGF